MRTGYVKEGRRRHIGGQEREGRDMRMGTYRRGRRGMRGHTGEGGRGHEDGDLQEREERDEGTYKREEGT